MDSQKIQNLKILFKSFKKTRDERKRLSDHREPPVLEIFFLKMDLSQQLTSIFKEINCYIMDPQK